MRDLDSITLSEPSQRLGTSIVYDLYNGILELSWDPVTDTITMEATVPEA